MNAEKKTSVTKTCIFIRPWNSALDDSRLELLYTGKNWKLSASLKNNRLM